MSAHSHMHPYLNLLKERIDEMDAALASLETKAGEAQAGSKVARDEFINGLKKMRTEFSAAVKKMAEAGGEALDLARAELDPLWAAFEGQIKAYMDNLGKDPAQQQAIFRDMAAAQGRAWRDAAEKLDESAQKAAAAHRGEFQAVANRMKAEAVDAEAQLHQLKAAGAKSWTAYSAALTESRKAFFHANETAWKALKQTAAH